MSFDIFLCAFNRGISVDGDVAAARMVLARHAVRKRMTAFVIKFADGSNIDLYADGIDAGDVKPFDGGMFSLHGVTELGAAFIFQFSDEAGLAIFPAMEPACTLVTREERKAHLPPGLCENRDVIVVQDEFELAAALKGGLAAWKAYRDDTEEKFLEGLNSGPSIPYTDEIFREKKEALIREHAKREADRKKPRTKQGDRKRPATAEWL